MKTKKLAMFPKKLRQLSYGTVKTLFVFMFILSLASCDDNEDKNGDQITQIKLELVTGVLKTPSGMEVPNATVFYDSEDEFYSTKTNSSGAFTLEVPIGEGQLHFQTGNGKLFKSTLDINVFEDNSLNVGNQILMNEGNLAFVRGHFDHIQDIITNMGYSISEVFNSDFEGDGLDGYDALFLNCGGDISTLNENSYQGLQNFVASGKSLYASDWALFYLFGEYGVNCNDPREGGFIDDSLLCGLNTGAGGLAEDNLVLNQELVAHIGGNNVDLNFDIGGWSEIHEIDEDFWETLIINQNERPLMIKSNKLEGTGDDMWYSDNGNKVTICHIPPGNPDNPQTITISVNALQAHLAHGDNIGSCDSATSGNIYYTSFHNHENEQIVGTSLMEYVILNL